MKAPTKKYKGKVFLLIFLMQIFFSNNIFCQKKYYIRYILPGKDTSYNLQQLGLKTVFDSKPLAVVYLSLLRVSLLNKGFPVASIDSVIYDSTSARAVIYLGEQYKWAQINTDSIDEIVLNSIDWNEKQFNDKRIDFPKLQSQQEKILNYYENSGYPFAQVSLENVEISGNKIKGSLRVKKGRLYHIDSIRVIGNAKIKNLFLQHYLGIVNGSVYNSQKLKQVSKLIHQLAFLHERQPWNVTMLGTGATLNLYLQTKKSSEMNALVGFLPGNTTTGKAQITADVHVNLNNSLGSGENILLNWQQLQPQSPRLNLAYTHPYIFNSNYGINFSFDLLKKDSSYLQLTSILALQYNISPTQSFKVFYENDNSYLLSGGIDTAEVIISKTLPANIDVSSGNLGIGYHFVSTNYTFNPRTGNELDITASAGIKNITKNSSIINLQDPNDTTFNFNSLYDSIKLKTYRFKIVTSAAHYFPVGRNNTFKTAVNVGLLQSPQNFLNELFLIGGYKLLRGFDEESIYANRYAVFTGEYRYIVGTNSYFFGFSDVGFTQTKYDTTQYSNSYISVGVGTAFETKFGLLNITYALGKRNDVPFDIRTASKVHFGYITYF